MGVVLKRVANRERGVLWNKSAPLLTDVGTASVGPRRVSHRRAEAVPTSFSIYFLLPYKS
jgi:hypothetical protein